MACGRETRFRVAEIKGCAIRRWMFLAWMSPLQPTVEEQSYILEI